jgi:hypothetical protein
MQGKVSRGPEISVRFIYRRKMPMASTIITTNADALSRAADAIKARGESPSKNAMLNAFAAAIAGPGHDWAYIKNAPEGQISQPGLAVPQSAATPPAPATAWVLHYDEQNGWGRAPMLFSTKEAALEFVAEDHSWWKHPDHPFQGVMDALAENGEYTFEPEDDLQDDYDPYQIWLQELPIEQPKSKSAAEPRKEATSKKITSHLVFFDAPVRQPGQGLNWDTIIFEDENALFAYVEENAIEASAPNWKDLVKPASECEMIAKFSPEAWVNNNATPVDAEGDDTWVVEGDELDPTQSDLDYLQYSRNAPSWVKNWGGPFTIEITIRHGDLLG